MQQTPEFRFFVQLRFRRGAVDVYPAVSFENAQHAATMAVREGWENRGRAMSAWIADAAGKVYELPRHAS